jgi:hypothetical protein
MSKVFFQKKARSENCSVAGALKKKRFAVFLLASLRAQRRYSLRRGFQNKLIHVEGFFSEESKETAQLLVH